MYPAVGHPSYKSDGASGLKVKMQARSLATSSFAARLFIFLLYVLGATATSEHGQQHHPRQWGGGRGGGASGRGGASNVGQNGGGGFRPQFGGPYRPTWFGQLQKRFDDVAIDGDKGIHTVDFLDAAQSLPAFFNLLSAVGFYPARNDNNANIQKVRNRYNNAPGDSRTLQSLVRNEKSDGVAYSGSAAEALLWLTRTLEFTAQSLRKDLNDNKNIAPDDPNPKKPLSEAFQKTYPGTLQKYHNSYQKSLFSAAWTFVPKRQDFYRRLAADQTSEAALEDAEKWVTALEKVVTLLKDFMNSHDSRW
ncbi:uncharacterized protein HMPREF1541_08786 [Cyphellophora europaea CBS 101466]|uniref:Glycolipid transfer protein domain-containing protein n=1 Tax=Cyphellophora europaea (strain CBS 101466) TaxID=1220924 RepID=W2RLC8_CYPE1|nr:uncharacterized protein HMPREF1541_08786 [Cyphellophora europaea CBS 101466]ETN36508.1 hypothetical protein HMPREF1541_08786 [Cyphellophora europaea CBS 101466]